MAVQSSDRLAVLIDADNAQAAIAEELLTEISRYGTASVKRAYGDWTTPNLKGWKEYLHKLAIQPIQQFSYTTGKNATDSSLIIDAMDLLHSGRFEGFCLVSSDSDFTRLATRLRESGVLVYGFGEEFLFAPAEGRKICASEVVPVFGRPTPMRWKRRSGRESGTPPAPHQLPRLTPSRLDRSEATLGSLIEHLPRVTEQTPANLLVPQDFLDQSTLYLGVSAGHFGQGPYSLRLRL